MTVRAHLVLLLGCAALAAGAATAIAAPTKKPAVIHASAPLPPAKPMSAEQKREQVTPAKQLFGEKKLPSLGKADGDRLLPARLPARRRRAAGQRSDLAGHAAVAQPQLGPSLAGQVPRALRAGRRQGDRLARRPGRRHGAAARRPGGVRPHEPSDRARRRHLVHADARPHAEPGRAREDRRHRRGRRRPQDRRSRQVDAVDRRLHPYRRRAARGRARAGQRRDQEGAVPDGGQAALRLDEQGAALVRARRPHPRAAEVPGRFSAMPPSAAGAGGRRLQRQGTGVLVQGQHPASGDQAGRQEAQRDDDGRPAAGLRGGAQGAGQGHVAAGANCAATCGSAVITRESV